MSFFGKPALGTEVEVTTRWKNYYYFRNSEYTENSYIGRVVAGNKGMDQNSFAIIDSQGQYREISLNRIIKLRYKNGKVIRSNSSNPSSAELVADVRAAAGSKGNKYILTKYQGKITCTCPGFTYYGRCKHVEQFDKLPKAS